MTIAQAFNEITVAQGGTPNNGGTITGAIDALNDTLAGSDQAAGRTIEDAVRLLGQHIGGGGSSVTVEALTATENKTYTAPEGKAYSPVTVNVAAAIPTPKITAQINIDNPSALYMVETYLVDGEYAAIVILDENIKSSDSVTGYLVPAVSFETSSLAWSTGFMAWASDESITEPYEFTYSNLINCTYNSEHHEVDITDPTQPASFTATLTIE